MCGVRHGSQLPLHFLVQQTRARGTEPWQAHAVFLISNGALCNDFFHGKPYKPQHSSNHASGVPAAFVVFCRWMEEKYMILSYVVKTPMITGAHATETQAVLKIA